MVYQLSFFPTKLEIDIKQELTQEQRVNYHALQCDCDDDRIDRPQLATNLLKIDGITQVQFERYTIHIYKNILFTWEEMLEKILRAILMENPTEKLFRRGPPFEYYYEDLQDLRDKKLSVRAKDAKIEVPDPENKGQTIKIDIPDPYMLPETHDREPGKDNLNSDIPPENPP